MSLFYDPVKRQAAPWVFPSFIVLTVVILIVGFVVSKKFADEKETERKLIEGVDIFSR